MTWLKRLLGFYFQADIDGQRFIDDLKRDVAKPIAFDAIMRVRTSTGKDLHFLPEI